MNKIKEKEIEIKYIESEQIDGEVHISITLISGDMYTYSIKKEKLNESVDWHLWKNEYPPFEEVC